MRSFLLSSALIICLTACGNPSEDATLVVTDAHVVDPAGRQTVALGGAKLTAKGRDIRLINVSSAAANRIEIHQTIEGENGRMQMRQMQDILIEEDKDLSLGRGGPHFMLFGFDDTLDAGDTIDLTLTYQLGDEAPKSKTVTATVRGLAEDIPHQGHGS